jgi:hypothetical protein
MKHILFTNVESWDMSRFSHWSAKTKCKLVSNDLKLSSVAAKHCLLSSGEQEQ